MGDGRDLTDLQIAILRILWAKGEATTQDVHGALRPDRDLALTTVATLLSRLERRKVIAHRREGRQHVYRALVSEKQVVRTKVRDLMETLFGGEPSALMSHLVGSDDVGRDDLREIRRLIDAAEQGAGGAVGKAHADRGEEP